MSSYNTIKKQLKTNRELQEQLEWLEKKIFEDE